MKLIAAVILSLLFLPFSVGAQKKQTDREFDDFKGLVKSVVSERADVKKSAKRLVESNRRLESEITYDKKGNRLTWKTYDYQDGDLFESVVYSRIDGDKVAVYEEVDNPNKIIQKVLIPDAEKPDAEYDYKFKYKYDGKGKILEEAWYQSDDALWLRYVYNSNGNQIEELVYDAKGTLNQKIVHTFDAKKREIEAVYFDTKTDKPDSKETFEYLGFDKKGNWTKRLTNEEDENDKSVMKPREVTYRKLIYY